MINIPIGMPILLLSFLYSITILVFFYSKRRVKTTENRLFGLLLIMNIVSILLEALGVFSHYIFKFPLLVYTVIFKLFFASLIIDMVIFSFYVLNLVELSDGISQEKKKKLEKRLKVIIFIVAGISLFVLAFLDVEFFSEGIIFYAAGPATVLAFFDSCLNVVWCSIYLVLTTKHSEANKKRNMPVVFFLIGLFVSAVIQMKFQYINLANSVITFINLLIYHSIENPVYSELDMAKNVATEATYAKKDFLSSMSHEIRTPLNAIVGLSQLIKEEKNSPDLDKDADEIFVASQNLLEIIDSILDANSISANEIEIENKDYELVSELNKITRIIDTMLINKDIKLELNYSENLPATLNGDVHKIKRILTNILTNAVKYTDQGSITFSVNTINKDNNCLLCFEIKDTGRGLDDEQKTKLFEQFYRREEDKDSNISGIGLGLSITKYFVDIMKGNITVDSEVNVGTTIKIEIPQRIVQLKETIEEL
ncbi:MAG: ATP-binding protein [Bacilli bacterium]|nr:ATP-binding protein [Bacilli bacterium]